MGCRHCLNSATPDGEHMDFETFKEAVRFQNMYGPSECIITGGEPFEHPKALRFINYAVENIRGAQIIISTNGLWLEEHPEYVWESLMQNGVMVLFQVSYDIRYYPIILNIHKKVFQLPNVTINRVKNVYPQGRALENKLKTNAQGPKCFNVRSIARQLDKEYRTLKNITQIMFQNRLICTPHIDIHGNIKLGESDLCPVCSNIHNCQGKIIKDIVTFRCRKCDHVTKKMSKEYQRLIGEL